MKIDIGELAIYTITQKFRREVTRRFDKLDEDFDLEEFLNSKQYKVSKKELESLERKVDYTWMSLSDEKNPRNPKQNVCKTCFESK